MVQGDRDMQSAQHARRRPRLLLLILIPTLLSSLGHAATYVYDASGRLRAMTSSTGESANYVYDDLGNLVAIDRIPASQLAMFVFTPNHGSVGTVVTIHGQGFSSTPGNNILTFNGLAATVTTATATKLTTIVPAGATTGLLSEIVGSASTTSLDTFVVTASDDAHPPTITSFSPLIADSTTTINVLGDHFAPVTGLVRAGVNTTSGAVTPYSDTQLAFQVPMQTGSGPVTVDTAYGTAQSSQPLVVVSSSVGAANVVASTNLQVDGSPQDLTISGNGKYAAATFFATSGENIGVGISELTATSTTYPQYANLSITVYNLNGAPLLNDVPCGISGCDMNLSNLPVSGTYTLLIRSANGDPSMVVSFSAAVSHDLVVEAASGAPTAVTLGLGQNGRLKFAGAAGTSGGMQIATSSTQPSHRRVAVTILKPDGTSLLSRTGYGSYAIELLNFPTTGTYTAFFDPELGATTSTSASLADETAGGLDVGGDSRSISADSSAYFGFSADAGSNIGIGISALAVQNNFYSDLNVTLYRPDGVVQTNTLCTLTYLGCDLNLSSAPVGGFYGVKVSSQYSPYEPDLHMSFVATATNDLAGTLTSTAPLPVELQSPGENARITFSGTSGEAAGIQVAITSTSPEARPVYVTVLKPDGSTFLSGGDYGGYAAHLANLPAAGAYTVFLDPQYGATMDANVRLVKSNDASGIPLNGPGEAVDGMTYSYFGFAADVDDHVNVNISDLVLDNNTYAYVYVDVRDPNGFLVLSPVQCYPINNGCDIDLGSISEAGFYGVILRSSSPYEEPGMTMNFTATVTTSP